MNYTTEAVREKQARLNTVANYLGGLAETCEAGMNEAIGCGADTNFPNPDDLNEASKLSEHLAFYAHTLAEARAALFNACHMAAHPDEPCYDPEKAAAALREFCALAVSGYAAEVAREINAIAL